MKKLIVFVALGVTSFLLTGCNTNTTVKNTEDNGTAKKASSSDVTKNECMNGCEMMWRSNGGNKGKTAADMDKDCNNLCNATQGMQNGDVSSCEKSEGILRDTCYSDIAKKTKDISICKKIEDTSFVDMCYSNIAEEKKDSSICENITNNIFKSSCLESSK